VKPPVQRAPCRSSSGRCSFSSPLWTYGSLSWLHGAVRDLSSRSGFPHRRGDRRLHQVFPHHATPHWLCVMLQPPSVVLRHMRRCSGPAVVARPPDPSACDRACGWFCHSQPCGPVVPPLGQAMVACVAGRRCCNAAHARPAAGQSERASNAGRHCRHAICWAVA
jgi:hypothetical protein